MRDHLYWHIFDRINEKCLAYHGNRYGPEKESFSTFIYGITESYSKLFTLSQGEFLKILEAKRGEEMPINFYQTYNFPALETVIIFQTHKEALEKCKEGFRCPYCHGISKDGQDCDTNILVDRICSDVKKKQPCNWKSYGLFSSCCRSIIIDQKTYIPVKIFKPVYLEQEELQEANKNDKIIDIKKQCK